MVAYRGMIDAWVEAATTANAGSPKLRKHARDQALKVVVDALYGFKVRNLESSGAPTISPEVIDARPSDDPSEVVIQDCFDSSAWIFRERKTGKIAEGDGPERQRFQALVRRADGAWKVDGLVVTGSC